MDAARGAGDPARRRPPNASGDGRAPARPPRRPPLGLLPLLTIFVLLGPLALSVVTRLHGGAQVAGFVAWVIVLDLVCVRFGYDSRDGTDWHGSGPVLPGAPAGGGPEEAPKSPDVDWTVRISMPPSGFL
ncbi:MAG: hypothetical protein ACRDJ5_04200 [Actinomycetota bacterium]